jgi:hypothetical protein
MSTFTPGPGTKYLLYSGGTVPTGSADGVLYLDANKQITTSASFTFNGTTLSAPAVQVDNVNINGNTVSATNTNGDLLLAANGTGQVEEVIAGVSYALASAFDVGTAPNQIPLNQYLGTMAFQDSVYVPVTVGGGITLGSGAIGKGTYNNAAGVKTISIILDLTGLKGGGTAGDIIGSDSTSVGGVKQASYVGYLPPDMVVLGGRMTCLETPAGGSTDIDLYSATENTGTQNDAISGLTETQIINGGAQSLGTVTYFAADPAGSQFFYMVSQGTTTTDYTAGRFLIEVFGV